MNGVTPGIVGLGSALTLLYPAILFAQPAARACCTLGVLPKDEARALTPFQQSCRRAYAPACEGLKPRGR